MPDERLIIFCSGMPRSGSTWSYNVCRLILDKHGQLDRTRCGYFGEGTELDDFLKNALAADKRNLLVKFHRPGSFARKLVLSGAAKNIYTRRDPRDAVVSTMKFFGRSFDTVVKLIRESLEMMDSLAEPENSLSVIYEAIVDHPNEAVAAIAHHLGLSVDKGTAKSVANELTLERLASASRDYSDHPIDDTVSRGNIVYHKDTLLHQGHITSGEHGRWRRELDPSQQQMVTEAFASWLVALGYETKDEQSTLR